MAITDSENAIRETVQLYFDSYLGANADGIAKAFHEDTRLLSVASGGLEKTELADWLPSLQARRERGDIRKAETKILHLDISGDAAVVKAKLQFKEFSFTDYLSLLKTHRGWRIVGKIYTTLPVGPEKGSKGDQ